MQRIIHTALVLLLVSTLSGQPSLGQENRSDIVRLIRVNGSFGTEVPAGITWIGEPVKAVAAFQEARIDSEPRSFLTRLRLKLTMVNSDPGRTISEVEWRLDIYDEKLGIASSRLHLSEKVKIAPGESGTATTDFGAVLPDRMLILLQVAGAKFSDGTTWVAPVECSLGKDLKSITCKPR